MVKEFLRVIRVLKELKSFLLQLATHVIFLLDFVFCSIKADAILLLTKFESSKATTFGSQPFQRPISLGTNGISQEKINNVIGWISKKIEIVPSRNSGTSWIKKVLLII